MPSLIEPFLLINGDDVSFPATDYIRAEWTRHIEELGWKKSPGKNYAATFSSSVAMQINSRLYQISLPTHTYRNGSLVTESSQIKRVHYLHYALAMGHRVKSEPSITLLTANKTLEKILEGHGYTERTSTIRHLFFSSNRELFRKGYKVNGEVFVPNWYVPTALGGLGFPCSQRVRMTTAQRKVASYLALNPLRAWVLEKEGSLPVGAQKAIQDLKKTLPEIVPRSRLPIGPLRYEQSMEYLEERFGSILGAYAWDRNPTSLSGDLRRHFLLHNRIPPKTPLMGVEKILNYRLDLSLAESCARRDHASMDDFIDLVDDGLFFGEVN